MSATPDEYRVISVHDGHSLEQELNRLSAEGFEWSGALETKLATLVVMRRQGDGTASGSVP